MAEVRLLRDETEEKAAELERALERLHRLTTRAEGRVIRPAITNADLPSLPSATDGPTIRPPDEELMLRVAQMALAGRNRREITAALRKTYGIDDPKAILDRVLGSSV